VEKLEAADAEKAFQECGTESGARLEERMKEVVKMPKGGLGTGLGLPSSWQTRWQEYCDAIKGVAPKVNMNAIYRNDNPEGDVITKRDEFATEVRRVAARLNATRGADMTTARRLMDGERSTHAHRTRNSMSKGPHQKTETAHRKKNNP
jgi:hypothetical protein